MDASNKPPKKRRPELTRDDKQYALYNRNGKSDREQMRIGDVDALDSADPMDSTNINYPSEDKNDHFDLYGEKDLHSDRPVALSKGESKMSRLRKRGMPKGY